MKRANKIKEADLTLVNTPRLKACEIEIVNTPRLKAGAWKVKTNPFAGQVKRCLDKSCSVPNPRRNKQAGYGSPFMPRMSR